MILLGLEFLSILLITFALLAVLMRRPAREKPIEQRIAAIGRSAGTTPQSLQLLKASPQIRFQALEEHLKNYRFSQKLRQRIRQANSSISVSTFLLSSIGLSLVGCVTVWIFVPIVPIDIFGAALGLLPYGILSFRRSRRIHAFDAALPESIEMMARAMRAGYSMLGAIQMLSESAQEPANREFGEVFRQQNLGLPLREALLELLGRVPSPDLQVLVTAILVQKETGGNLVEMLNRSGAVIRERLRVQAEIRIHTAQGRLTGWILSMLPVLLMVILNIVNPGYSHILFYDSLGRKLIYVSIGLLSAGTVIIQRIVHGIEV